MAFSHNYNMVKKINYTQMILDFIKRYERISLADLTNIVSKNPTFVKNAITKLNTGKKIISIKNGRKTHQNPTGILYISKIPSNSFSVDIKEYQINLGKESQHVTYYDNKLHRILIYFNDQALKRKKVYSNIDRYNKIKCTIKNSKYITTFIISKNAIKKYNINNEKPAYTWKNNCMIIQLQKNKNVQDLPKLDILIFDDRDIRTLDDVHGYLTPKHRVKKLMDQNTVINRLKTKSYDYLILDWVVNGQPLKIEKIMELLRIKNPKGKAIIITGADYTSDDIDEYRNYGVIGMIHKNKNNLPEKIGDAIWSSYVIEKNIF